MLNEELNIQSQIVSYLRTVGLFVFSVPNGTNVKNVRSRVLLKRSGLYSGVSDLIIVLNNEVIFVEVKTERGRQSDNQIDFQERVMSMGHKYYVWRSVKDAEHFVHKELKSIGWQD